MFHLLWQKKLISITLLILCISRSLAVIFLNKGYAELLDNILSGTLSRLMSNAVMLLITGGIQVGIIVLQSCMSSRLSEKIGCSLRTEATDGILNAEYKTIKNLNSGESLSKLNTDLPGITVWVKNELAALLSDSILFITVLIAMLYMNWKLTALSFCIVPFFSVGSYLLSKPITSAEKEKNKAVADVNVIAKSIIDAFPVLKIFQMQKPLLCKVDEKITVSVAAELKANNIRAKLMSVNGFISYMPTAVMLGFGGHMVITGKLSAGSLLAFTNMSNFVRAPLVNLPGRIDALRTSSANASRVFEMLDHLKYQKRSTEGSKHFMDNNVYYNENAVEFRNVSFGYSGSKSNLVDISFKIKRGSKVVIAGESGCGKSTVLKLISGLYFTDSGDVLINGNDIKKSSLEEVRKNISFVPQEAQLFPVSILDNITCGHVVSMSNVIAACEAAQLMDFINLLPDGIHTSIGECGNKISGGERQRICLARALAKDAPLLLLDEATSALDGHTEKAVLRHLDTLIRKSTVIFVTHKIKNAVDADFIICMKNGQICEAGSHNRLMAADGYYAKLFRVQNMLEVLTDEDNSKAV